MPDLDAGVLVYNIKHPNFGAVVDGVTDDTLAIQRAIDAAAAAGGGVVFHPGGISQATRIRLKSRVTLAGAGWGSTFRQKSGTTGHFVVLNDVNVEQTGLRDLRIHGNKQQQTAQNDGVNYTNDGGSFSFGDPVHRISNVLITDISGTGLLTSAAARECRVSDVYVNGADKDGFFILGTDSVFERCTAGSSGIAGFRCRAANTRYLGCKAFGSGRLVPSAIDLERPRRTTATNSLAPAPATALTESRIPMCRGSSSEIRRGMSWRSPDCRTARPATGQLTSAAGRGSASTRSSPPGSRGVPQDSPGSYAARVSLRR